MRIKEIFSFGSLEKPQFHRYPFLRKYSFRILNSVFRKNVKPRTWGFSRLPVKFLSLFKRFNCRRQLSYQTSTVSHKDLFQVLLLLTLTLSSCSRLENGISNLFTPTPPEPPFSCSVTTTIDKDFRGYLDAHSDNGLQIRVGIAAFNVPKNFSSVAMTVNGGYGIAIAGRFREQFLKNSPSGIFEFFSAEQMTFYETKRDFERSSDKLINFAKEQGFNTLVLGQLNPITNSSELNFTVRIIDLNSRITVWLGETSVTAAAKSKDVSDSNQSMFYFSERLNKAAECTVETALKKHY